MKIKQSLLAVALTLSSIMAYSQNASPRIKVSANKRFLVYEDGRPFFYLGDTGWELFHRLDRKQAETYLKIRASQGFTVIQAVILAEENGLKDPNPYGQVPFLNYNTLEINESYFLHVDYIIDLAAKLGITIALLPTWGDKVDKAWGQGPVIFTPEKAFSYGTFVGKRYKDKTNIIWVMGGDRAPEPAHVDVFRAMAAGVTKGVGDTSKVLFTFHPPGGRSSAEWFHSDTWLGFNMMQTGHCRDVDVYDRIQRDYARSPAKPVMDGEPIYEDHPVCFDARNHGFSTEHDIRKSAYWGVFAGGHGHTYGCHNVWQMYDYMRLPVNNPRRPWYNSLDLPGAGQMKFLKNLMLSRPYLVRVPDQSIITSDNPKGPDYKVATRASDYSYIFVYYPIGGSASIDITKLPSKTYKMWWYNPKDGSTTNVVTMDKKQLVTITAPTNGYGNDWILVLDDASKSFSTPGVVNP